ncbi:MAG: DUF1501 domain-containing protein [Planctomycetota bacterium]|nr:MAG: DUF1501 domain-containing protein [Planctomycetota bacterium]REK40647.1 MAG: DUF1501 domain-containing protein [Planctomycetota bacterium]
MAFLEQLVNLKRRQFLASSANAVGALALTSMLSDDGLLAAERAESEESSDSDAASVNPLEPKPPHFVPRAKNCIFIFLAGGPSQIDLYDPKPKLVELNGQALPESMTENVRFAFIKKESAKLAGSPRKFEPRGQCGMELSDLLPHLSTCADDMTLVRSLYTEQFNHHPAQLMLNTGVGRFGRPSFGSWLNYGLGSESRDLPGFVVLTAGRGSSGGTSNWSSGFLPSTYQGVLFRGQGDPVLNLANPPGVTREMQRESLELIKRMNQRRLSETGDDEIASRIAAYELAFRMQAAAPELIDFSGESQQTRDAYGVDRGEPEFVGERGGGPTVHADFARNCLLARRMVERGVRFVNIVHASWDHHSDLEPELKYNTSVLDQPVAALIKDLKQRSLLDSTLVVIAGEFGRTPLGENRVPGKPVTGRDHHPFAFSVLLAGGGIKAGQVVGKTDEIGWSPIEDPMHMNDFHATLLHLFGLDHLKLTVPFGGLDMRLTNVGGKVVEKLLA